MSGLLEQLTDGIDIVWALLAAVIVAVLCDLASEEIRGRLEQLPELPVRLAARRLPRQIPREIRDDQVAEWLAVLHDILHDTELRPVTRLCRGLRHGLGVLRTARTIGRELSVTSSPGHLITVFPRDPLDPADWSTCTPLLGRVQAVLRQVREQRVDTRERADLLLGTARYLLRTGISPEAALHLHREALGIRRRLHRAGRLSLAELADGYHNVAYNLREMRQFRRALVLDAHVLRVRRDLSTDGDDNAAEHLARSLTSLASDHRGCGEAAQAHPLDREALDIRRGLCRRGHLPDDRDVARSLNNLAEDERMLGDLEPARRHAEEGLAMRLRLFDTDHPDLVNSLDTLAEVYRELGHAADAIGYRASARAMRQRLGARWAGRT
ncbi:tetratricopeptide repeat protein [Polymorphospora sp. NPDC050346]|uniref:tetratricopeptide repeat protein n=1 Tax=Polymorphospora sp. NPDC050346 TaxID=3155780 RepID=UPI0033F9B1C5